MITRIQIIREHTLSFLEKKANEELMNAGMSCIDTEMVIDQRAGESYIMILKFQ